VTEIQSICSKCDVLFLQATWLYDQDLAFLSNIHADFYGRGVSLMYSGMISGHPYGGLGILWRKSFGQHCKVINYEDDRIMGFEVVNEHRKMLLVNVYLPFDNGCDVA
jgi:hypothetical protein